MCVFSPLLEDFRYSTYGFGTLVGTWVSLLFSYNQDVGNDKGYKPGSNWNVRPWRGEALAVALSRLIICIFT